jgi:heme exporter protein A
LTYLLQTIDLHCERDGRNLVDGLNLNVESGHIYQVEGPNGSGKTTLLRVLCGLSSRYFGELLWRGQPIRRVSTDYYSKLLYLGHSSGVKAVLTARENLAWHAALQGLTGDVASDAITKALAKVGLYGYEDAACFTLSAGQQRRVGLARLFLGRPLIWILDEPFTAIDKQGVSELEAWISAFAEQGGTIILTTHHELNIKRPVARIRLGERA